MDAGERDSGKWMDTVSPFDLSRTLLVGGGLLVPYSLSGSPVIKQLMQMVTMVPGQGWQFQSVCFPRDTRRYSRGERSPLLPLEPRPDYVGVLTILIIHDHY